MIPIVLVVCGLIVIPPLIHKFVSPELPAAVLRPHKYPRQISDFKFYDGSNRRITLNRFRGSFVLLNIWATWCGPCIEEMASLNRLVKLFKRKDLIIVPISIDISGVPAVRAFYSRQNLNNLNVYVDPSKEVMHALAGIGIPTTLLINPDGLEIARTVGAARWDAPATVERISYLVKR